MGNRDKAKELREKNASTDDKNTQEALASAAEEKEATVTVEKLQDELDNTKSLLQDAAVEKEALQTQLDAAKTTEAEQTALLAKRDGEIATLTATVEDNASDAQSEITALKTEVGTLMEDAETSKSEYEDLAAKLVESKKEVTALKTKIAKLEKK